MRDCPQLSELSAFPVAALMRYPASAPLPNAHFPDCPGCPAAVHAAAVVCAGVLPPRAGALSAPPTTRTPRG